MLFLSSNQPIHTCVSETCTDCAVFDTLHCHFRPMDLIHFLTVAFPSFLIGGAGLYLSGWWPLVLWLAMVFGFFGFLEIRVMCSHCPHYAESGGSLKCWANYGSPKLWKYRPGPMNLIENLVFFTGLGAVWIFPLIFLVSGGQWFLLIVFVISTAGFFLTLKTGFCSRCMNFACPLNGVSEYVRNEFFKRNPEVAGAWGKSVDRA